MPPDAFGLPDSCGFTGSHRGNVTGAPGGDRPGIPNAMVWLGLGIIAPLPPFTLIWPTTWFGYGPGNWFTFTRTLVTRSNSVFPMPGSVSVALKVTLLGPDDAGGNMFVP